MFPLRIKDKTLLIDKDGRIENDEVFKAVCNGHAVDLSIMKNPQGEQKIIDV